MEDLVFCVLLSREGRHCLVSQGCCAANFSVEAVRGSPGSALRYEYLRALVN